MWKVSRLIPTTIQYIQRTMVMTVSETLTALFKQLYIGLALFGAGMGGIPLTFEDIKDL
jgi:hypothetical protein